MGRPAFLTLLMLCGLAAGVMVGQLYLFNGPGPVGNDHWMRQVGTIILIRPLLMLVIPLVFISVVLAVASIGSPARLGLVGGATLFFFLATMLLASSLGAFLAWTFRPGDLPADQRHALTVRADAELAADLDASRAIEQARKADQADLPGSWAALLDQISPVNIVRQAMEGRTLGIIVLAVLLGLSLAAGGSGAEPAIRVFQALHDALLRIVGWLIWLAPAGVFFLVASTVGKIGLATLSGPLGRFMGLVAGGLALHGLIVLPMLLWIFGRANPFRYVWRMRPALITAFGTASSAATLPVTLACSIARGGCSRRAAGFVIPLGAAVNMAGTALFEAAAVIFLCQLHGIDLQFGELLVVVITATLAAIGAAGMPGAGLVTMVIVVGAVNLSLASRNGATLPAGAIGVIIAIDRLLDMCRTTLNVWSDLVAAKIISRLAPDSV